ASPGASSPPIRKATSERNRAASSRQATTVGVRKGSRAGAGQSTVMASKVTAEASPQPASRLPSEENGPGRDTGRMKASSSAVEAPASTELTTPTNSTTNATTAITAA